LPYDRPPNSPLLGIAPHYIVYICPAFLSMPTAGEASPGSLNLIGVTA
jgi:hypothetical protein